MKSIIRAICAAGLGLLTLQAPARAEDTIDAIRSRGVLRIPGIINEDPYFNKDPRSGEWRGFAIEMARDIANTLGVKLEVVESSWPNSILDVQSGKVDLALGVTATPQRALSVAFTNPTYFNSFVIVSPKPDLSKLSWAELNDPKYTFAVDLGSSQDLIAQQYLPKAKMLRFKSRDEAIVAVVTGKADGLVNTMLNGLVMSKNDPPPPTGPGRLLVDGWPRGQRGRRSRSGLRSRPRGHGGDEDLRRGRLVSERAMGAHGVEVPPPAFDDDLRLREGVENLAVEEFIAQPGIERLDEAILPGAAGCDVGGLRANRADPLLHGLGDKFRPVI